MSAEFAVIVLIVGNRKNCSPKKKSKTVCFFFFFVLFFFSIYFFYDLLAKRIELIYATYFARYFKYVVYSRCCRRANTSRALSSWSSSHAHTHTRRPERCYYYYSARPYRASGRNRAPVGRRWRWRSGGETRDGPRETIRAQLCGGGGDGPCETGVVRVTVWWREKGRARATTVRPAIERLEWNRMRLSRTR